MAKYTVYLKRSAVPADVPYKIGKHLINLGAKLLEPTVKAGKIVFEHSMRPCKHLMPHSDKILAIINHEDGRNRYHRTKTSAKPKVTSLTPMQVAKAYNFPAPAGDLSKQCVALIELGGSVNPYLISLYCQNLKMQQPHMTSITVDGAKQLSDGPDGADGEVDLDACVVAAIAPGVQILTIFAPNTDQGFCDAVLAAIDSPLKPCSISISWGSPEEYWTADVRSVMDDAFKTAIANGMNVFVAAGDNGSSDGVNDGQNHVDYPASSPYAIACGGTELVLNTDGSRYSETVWGHEGATGGGQSKLYSWRSVPDIAGNASPSTGYIVNVDGEMMAIGGTSAVAPLYAAMTALITGNLGKPIGYLVQLIVDNPAICVDIVSGSNGAFKAKVGYDMCTGSGVVDGGRLMDVLTDKSLPPQEVLPTQPSFIQQALEFLKSIW